MDIFAIFYILFYTKKSVVKAKQELSLNFKDIFLKIVNDVISPYVPELYCKEI